MAHSPADTGESAPCGSRILVTPGSYFATCDRPGDHPRDFHRDRRQNLTWRAGRRRSA